VRRLMRCLGSLKGSLAERRTPGHCETDSLHSTATAFLIVLTTLSVRSLPIAVEILIASLDESRSPSVPNGHKTLELIELQNKFFTRKQEWGYSSRPEL
jgi:hypothetical protein